MENTEVTSVEFLGGFSSEAKFVEEVLQGLTPLIHMVRYGHLTKAMEHLIAAHDELLRVIEVVG